MIVSRRQFLAQAGAGAAATTLLGAQTAQTADAPATARSGPKEKPFNIVFVFTDQERYFRRSPKGLSLPGHEAMARRGVTFHQHYCPAVMCTSSRAVLMTGLQTADNRMFENADAAWVQALSPGIPTIGHMLREAGYYTAYKGKWHLNAEFEGSTPNKLFTAEMEPYGFSDYTWAGDILAHELGGYRFDHLISGSAVSWLRNKGRPMADDGKPWALTVSLVNPHDIMYFNTDRPDERVQDTGQLMMHSARAPAHPDYAKTYDLPLPASLRQPFDEPGRPHAHGEYDKAWGHTLGRIPQEDERWQRFTDYYLNCIRAVDKQLATLLAELDALRLADNTIVVYTADHGEMGGAHGLRGKGAFAYEESLHLPFYVMHPDVRGGQDCRALSSHIDVAPTLLAWAGLDSARRGDAAGRDLPGHDLSPALSDARAAKPDTVRDSVLFTFSGLAQNDSELMRVLAAAAVAGQAPKEAMQASGFRPDLRKRGSLRTVFDGQHKFTRYFSPLERNRPTTVDALHRYNDCELYDLAADPAEMTNLAPGPGVNEALVVSMNTKLNTILDAEFGRDDGREMPEVANISWALDRVEL